MTLMINDFKHLNTSETFIDIKVDYYGEVVSFSPYAIKKLLVLAKQKGIIPKETPVFNRQAQEKGKRKSNA